MTELNSNVQMENLSDIKRKLEIVVPSAAVTAAFDKACAAQGSMAAWTARQPCGRLLAGAT